MFIREETATKASDQAEEVVLVTSTSARDGKVQACQVMYAVVE